VAALRETLERELKLAADAGFELPELPGEPLEPRAFTSTYFDTDNLGLARAGVTLRRRVEARKSLWQLKLPRGAARLELEQPGGPGGPPADVRDLLGAYLRGGALTPVATLRTRRAGVRVHDEGGPVADVVIDSVAVLDGRRTADSFTELEVELLGGDERALRRIERLLRAAGARKADGRPKLFRALGLERAVLRPSAGPSDPPLEHLQGMFRAQLDAIVAHDAGTRLGSDPEELHQMRVATRRMRAFLRAGRDLLDHEWAEGLRAELAWLGGALGPVRDTDVLVERLHAGAAGLDPREERALGRLFGLLAAEREEGRERMLEGLRSERYLGLLDRLEAAAVAPRTTGAAASLRDIAAAEFRRLRKAARALGPEPSDDELHDLRIRGKRARYAAELAERSVGKPAARFIGEAKAFQDVLGEHQDAVVAEERIRDAVRRGGGSAFALVRPGDEGRIVAAWQRVAAEAGLTKAHIFRPGIARRGLVVEVE